MEPIDLDLDENELELGLAGLRPPTRSARGTPPPSAGDVTARFAFGEPLASLADCALRFRESAAPPARGGL